MKTLKEQFEAICNKYADAFGEKHEMKLEYWVDIGNIALFADYYISFNDMRYDIDEDIPEEMFIKYYDYSLDAGLKNAKSLNYKNFCKLNKYEKK